MSSTQYWAVLIKKWKLIATCFVLVGLGAYIASKLMTPLYQSSVLIQITFNSASSQSDYNSLLAGDQLVQTEAQLATSEAVLGEVASHYQGMTLEQLQREVTAGARPNTQLFEINVLDPNPTQSANLANDVAATLIEQQLQLDQQANLREEQQLEQDLNSAGRLIDPTTIKTVLAQLELTQAQNEDLLRIVQPALPPLKPSQPSVLLNTAVGLSAGLLLGILLALAYAQLDTRVRSAEALTELVGWPILATVWRLPSSKKKDIVNPSGQNATNEAYRILRTNIGFAGVDKPPRSLLITSAIPNEGKSTIAANLAIFMAKAGKNTLLIDADMHRPVQHVLFDLPADKKGFSNAILAYSTLSLTSVSPSQPASAPYLDNASLEPFMHSVGIPHLWVMPSGPLPPNPSEMLDSKSLLRLLTVIANSGVEMVIFDSPPLLGLSDATILAPKIDGTLVVVDISRARKGVVRQLKDILTTTGTHVLGCVANKQHGSRHDHTYSYYYHHRTKARQNEKSSSVQNGKVRSVPDIALLSVSLEPAEDNKQPN
jgi:Mrp family chromosome partitioning ATPase/capsular polysaccharide biosynthesis protein